MQISLPSLPHIFKVLLLGHKLKNGYRKISNKAPWGSNFQPRNFETFYLGPPDIFLKKGWGSIRGFTVVVPLVFKIFLYSTLLVMCSPPLCCYIVSCSRSLNIYPEALHCSTAPECILKRLGAHETNLPSLQGVVSSVSLFWG